MDNRHFHASLGKAMSRLYTAQAAADRRRAAARPQQGTQRADIGEIAERKDVLQIHSGLRQPDRLRAGREHEFRKGKALAVREGHHPAAPIDRYDGLAISSRDAAPVPPSARLQFDRGLANFPREQRRQKDAVVGEPRLGSDDDDAVAAERTPPQFVDETGSRHAIADNDERFAHVVTLPGTRVWTGRSNFAQDRLS